MKVRVLRPALEDLAAGREFYDRQREGVGSYFFNSVFAEIDSLVLYAGIHRMHFGYHRLLAKRFPYAVYYRVIGSEAIVHRVLDCRRDPTWLRRALHEKA
jgi:plasmid stabilization system protein ParE